MFSSLSLFYLLIFILSLFILLLNSPCFHILTLHFENSPPPFISSFSYLSHDLDNSIILSSFSCHFLLYSLTLFSPPYSPSILKTPSPTSLHPSPIFLYPFIFHLLPVVSSLLTLYFLFYTLFCFLIFLVLRSPYIYSHSPPPPPFSPPDVAHIHRKRT